MRQHEVTTQQWAYDHNRMCLKWIKFDYRLEINVKQKQLPFRRKMDIIVSCRLYAFQMWFVSENVWNFQGILITFIHVFVWVLTENKTWW